MIAPIAIKINVFNILGDISLEIFNTITYIINPLIRYFIDNFNTSKIFMSFLIYIKCTPNIVNSANTDEIAAPTVPIKFINIKLNITFTIAPIVTDIV